MGVPGEPVDLPDFDYVVIGGGTAGAVVARRLAEHSFSVCLLEAGPDATADRRVRFIENWAQLLGSELAFDYRLEPDGGLNPSLRPAVARMLGGCSAHNNGAAVPPTSYDLSRWVAAGAMGWGPDAMAGPWHSVRQRVYMYRSVICNEVSRAFLASAHAKGYPWVDSPTETAVGDVEECVSALSVNARGRERESSAVAYLYPRDQRPSSLVVRTDCTALRLVLDTRRRAVTGVETTAGTITARRETIVCCGALNSPKLLMVSGIGPATHLHQVGIQAVADLPVGEHLLDHSSVPLTWSLAEDQPRASPALPESIGLFARSSATKDVPDLMFHFVPRVNDRFGMEHSGETPGFTITPYVRYPRSEGRVLLRSADPYDRPRIFGGYFTDSSGSDLRVLMSGIRIAREIVSEPPLRDRVRAELHPGASVTAVADLQRAVRARAQTLYHPAGTCRMGSASDPASVVDPELRVLGVERLRVADASVFPTMVGVNPCMTVLMIGERCAELLLSSPAVPRP